MKRLVRCWGPCCAKLDGVAGCGVPAPGGPKRIMILRPILAVAAVCGLNGVLFEGRFSFTVACYGRKEALVTFVFCIRN